MRVLWLSTEAMSEGALGVTGRFEAIRHLRARGMDVRVICGAPAGAVPLEGLPTTFLRTRYVPFLAWLTQWPVLSRELERLGPGTDVIISDFALLPPVMRYRRDLRRHRRPVPKIILDIRSQPVEAGRLRTTIQNQRFDWTLRLCGPQLDGLSAVTEDLRSRAARLTGIPVASIETWQAGCRWCDEDHPRPPWPKELPDALRQRFVVIYHGSITPGRGLSATVRAIALLRTEAPDLRLVLLGAGWGVSDLKTLAREAGVADRVVFVPSVAHDRVPEFLGAAGVGLIPLPPGPSWDVNFPVKLTEYLCFGLPVVLTDIKPHRIVPATAPFAFWAGQGGPEEQARAMLEAYGKRQSLARCGATARTWAVERLGWQPQIEVLERMLRTLDRGPG